MIGVITLVDPAKAELRAMVDRFSAMTLDWDLVDGEVEALLDLAAGRWPALRDGPAAPDAGAETRMRRAIEVAALLRDAFGDDALCREWLRRPNAAILGRMTPLDLVCDRDVGLRAMRDRLRDEAMQARVPS